MNIKFISLIVIVTFLCSCASSTQINTIPAGADLYIGSEKVGKTPYFYTDTHVIDSVIHIKMSRTGYEDLSTTFTRDEEIDIGPLLASVFFIPFLWHMKYKPEHTYEMKSLVVENK